ncbi:hypothetical protein EBX31_13690 [bacterium]|nr:hypothetical protein [bacterium]
MSKLSAFVTSHFAPCDSIPDRIKTKFPFYFNRRELALFEDLSPDARAGGFGPLYGGCLLLALGSLAVLFVSKQKPLPAALFPIVPVLISTGLSQTWWARWVSQAWLIPVCLLLPVLTCLRNQPPGFRWVPAFLCLFTGLLNSFLILAFYTSGCLKSQRVLDSQLAFLKSLPQPLSVHMSRFPSNRLWFQREGIDFRTVENPPSAPRLRMFRTDTTVALPEGWKNTPAAVGLVASWKKMRLLQE